MSRAQDVATNEICDSDLDADPNGRSRDLGDEIDVIIGWRQVKNLRVEVIGGYFMPGRSFDTGDDAFLFHFETRYRF